nr:immunoglobulin heavy chain junction region [Mus musculus]
FCAREITYFDY